MSTQPAIPENPVVQCKLAKKLCEVAADLPRIEERGVLTDGDKVSTVMLAADLFDAIRPELAKRNVFVLPRPRKYDFANGRVQVSYDFHFIDADSGEGFTIEDVRANVIEKSDKGIQAAATVALKTVLCQMFMVSHGQDLEATLRGELGYEQEEQRVNGVSDENSLSNFAGKLTKVEAEGDFYWVTLGARRFTCKSQGVIALLRKMESEGRVFDVHVRGRIQRGWKYWRIEEVVKEGQPAQRREKAAS